MNEAGIRGKVKVLIGGAPVTSEPTPPRSAQMVTPTTPASAVAKARELLVAGGHSP